MPTPTFDLIETKTLANSSTTNLTFTSIPQTYTHLYLICACSNQAGDGNGLGFRYQLNGITSSTYRTFYCQGSAHGSAPATAVETASAEARLGFDSGTADRLGIVETIFPNYRDTTFYKVANSRHAHSAVNNDAEIGYYFSSTEQTAAITSIKLYHSNQTIAFTSGSTFSLYGVL
jgi:hypothetical protein